MPYTPPVLGWAFGYGDLGLLNTGGVPVTLFADTVFPWTKPADPGSLPFDWDPDAPPPDDDHGQYEGWTRNMGTAPTAPDTETRNFPTASHCNAVLVSTLSLKDSSSAPYPYGSDIAGLQRWPFRLDMGATDLMLYYIATYLNTGGLIPTAIIPALPLREVMNYLGRSGIQNGPPANDPNNIADPVAGETALVNFIIAILASGASVMGWYIIDEPDGEYLRGWATPGLLSKLRKLVRDTERAWRLGSTGGVPNDAAFAGLSATDREFALRPCMLTLTDHFTRANPLPTAVPKAYKDAGAADIYMIDFSPFRRSWNEVLVDYDEHCFSYPATIGTYPYEFEDPARCIAVLRKLWTDLNVEGQIVKLPGQIGYLPVINWLQTDGWPFRGASVTPSSATEPTSPPLATSGECARLPSFHQLKRMPDIDELRYIAWASLLDLSEGFAFFSQTQISDDLIRQNCWPLTEELVRFHRMRFEVGTQGNLRSQVTPSTAQLTAPLQPFLGNPLLGQTDCRCHVSLKPRLFYVDWTQGLGVPALQPYNHVWFGIVNSSPSPLNQVFTFNNVSSGGPYDLQEIRFLAPITPETARTRVQINAVSGQARIIVPPYRFRLFRRIPRSA